MKLHCKMTFSHTKYIDIILSSNSGEKLQRNDSWYDKLECELES